MKQYGIVLIKTLLFWLIFFAVGRIVFLLVYTYLLSGISAKDILSVFVYGLRLDVSTVCYLMSIPILIHTVQLCFKSRVLVYLLRAITCLELLFTSIVTFAEIGIYGEWYSKLNYKALVYLRHPKEIFQTATIAQIIFGIAGVAVLVGGFYYLYRQFVLKPPVEPLRKQACLKSPLVFLFAGSVCFFGMRGGMDAIPIKQSSSYFSHHTVLNDVAVNSSWNIIYNIVEFSSLENNTTYCFTDSKTADNTVKELLTANKDTTVNVLKKEDVNIVIILLESWTADVTLFGGGSNEISPCFNALAENGLLFTEFYSNGHRSQQAICSILSGFPSIPNYDITDNHSKYRHLPSLLEPFNKKGYATSFYFGGNLDYGNIRSFLLHADFKKITEDKDLPGKFPRGKLGIHDEYMFDYHLNEINQMKEPFFTMLFTVSSHSPYDEPKNITPLDWDTEQLKFLNSVKYCDYWLGDYMKKAKEQPWYNNTLFIIVADHGHPSHLNRSYYDQAYQRIPMLWYGNVLNDEYKGTSCEVLSSHVDVATTLLKQLNIDVSPFEWGKNIFNPYCKRFVYHENNKGFGWIEPAGSYNYSSVQEDIFDFTGDESKKDSVVFRGKAYTQKLFETYIAY
ncbi:MAG: sulfatase-like hydrolase/transferase [Bacteroidales bacterium]|jgi:phosphoglycerol transferase MdoB-like AlkP superfamily enzyme|nr:sulfatase-like hydrolase/transferase [Bacteroidales bacterium]